MSAPLAFLACVEQGPLEPKGLLLFRSIRRYCGRLASARIVSFNPRGGPPLSPTTLRELDALGVERVDLHLNPDFGFLPWSNKIFAGVWAEQHLDEEILVLLDSDTFFCREPDALLLPRALDAAARPVNRKRRGSAGPGDERDAYWLRLYEMCGVAERPFLETTVSRERIRAYWNAGLVAVRREAGLFAAWERDFRMLMAAEHWLGKPSMKNLDQFALAATLARLEGKVAVLDGRYNYPLPWRGELREPLRSAPLEELVHVHYFGWFNMPGFLAALDPPLCPDSEIVRWLAPQLPLPPIDTAPSRGNKDSPVE